MKALEPVNLAEMTSTSGGGVFWPIVAYMTYKAVNSYSIADGIRAGMGK